MLRADRATVVRACLCCDKRITHTFYTARRAAADARLWEVESRKSFVSLRNAVVGLGPGASKGARVTGGRTPPLDAEFLAVAGTYFRGKRARGKGREKVKAWNDFRSHLNSAGLEFSEIRTWRLEQLSTFLEARASLRSLQLGRGRPRDFAAALDSLKVVICQVLQFEGGARVCEMHKKLFQVVSPSGVVSFNYDLIADQSMLDAGLLNWRASEYRG